MVSLVDVELTSREDDGAAWFSEGRIFVNLRWVNVEDEIVWYIDESFMHEYVEHVLGLGHRGAVFVERVLRRLLYRDWFGREPEEILYSEAGSSGGGLPSVYWVQAAAPG